MTAARIVFVSHNASRSGAPLLLLAFQRWLRAHAPLEIATVLLDGGPLQDAFEEVGPVLELAELPETDADLVYLNTVGSAPALAQVSSGRPVLCHVHELDYALRHWISEADRARLRERVTRFVVVSDLVGDAVRRCLEVDPARVSRLYGFIDVDDVRRRGAPPAPLPHQTVGTSGTTEWRKAPDLFVELARSVHRRRPDTRFCWVGGSDAGPEIDRVLADRDRCGLEAVVDFVGERNDAPAWFAGCELFVLLSRDDPFPLTCLEAAALGVPVLAFDSTGAREFLADGAGVVIPYPDVGGMADAVVDLLDDRGRRRLVAAEASRRVRTEHDISVGAPRLLAEIERCLP